MKITEKIISKNNVECFRVNFATEIKIPKKKQFRFISTFPFNTIEILAHIIEQVGDLDECILSYSAISKKAIDFIKNALESGKIKKLYFFVAFKIKKDKPKLVEELSKLVELYKGRFFATLLSIHSKIMCCKSGKDFYVLEGSGNISTNARIEQYLFENKKNSYDFHKSWMISLDQFENDEEYLVL